MTKDERLERLRTRLANMERVVADLELGKRLHDERGVGDWEPEIDEALLALALRARAHLKKLVAAG